MVARHQDILGPVLVVVPCLVIPYLNEEKHIEKVVTRLLAESDRLHLKIVIADGGSTDRTLEIARRLSKVDRRVVLMDDPKRIAAAVNDAMRKYGDGAQFLIRIDAHASYPDRYCEHLLQVQARTRANSVMVTMHTEGCTCFQRAAAAMDSDDLMHPERLAQLVDAARRDRAGMVADNLVEFHSDGSRPPRLLLAGQWPRIPFWIEIIDYIRLNQLYGSGPALGYLKSLFRTSILSGPTTRYDESLKIGEDYDLVLRLLHSGETMRVYPQPFYFYRKHGSSISHRLNESVLEALKAANRRFLAQVSKSDRHLVAAINASIRSIETALAYEWLLNALKGRDWLGSLRIALTNPRAAVLLRLPVNARLRRLASWRRAGKSADHPLAAQLSRLVHPLGRGIEPHDEVKEAWESHMHLTAARSAEPRK